MCHSRRRDPSAAAVIVMEAVRRQYGV
jgi:hypothetical protein